MDQDVWRWLKRAEITGSGVEVLRRGGAEGKNRVARAYPVFISREARWSLAFGSVPEPGSRSVRVEFQEQGVALGMVRQGEVPSAARSLAAHVRLRIEKEGVFGGIEDGSGLTLLVAPAKDAAAAAEYRLEWDARKKGVFVSLVMADRWLSESIESHLVEHGDKMEELLDDELVEVGYFDLGGAAIEHIEHFRSDDRLFTFRALVPLGEQMDDGEAVDLTTRLMLGFEACFRQLGDMEGGEGEE